jgi:hypothetical protein
MSSSELTLPAELVGEALCFNYIDTIKHFTIECNWCSQDDYMFYDGEDPDSKWFVRVVEHIMKYHKNML